MSNLLLITIFLAAGIIICSIHCVFLGRRIKKLEDQIYSSPRRRWAMYGRIMRIMKRRYARIMDRIENIQEQINESKD